MDRNQPSYLSMDRNQPSHQQQHQITSKVAKTTTAVTLGGSLLVLSGLTLAATVVGLVITTPLLVIFSPVLVPAAITMFLIAGGFLVSGGLGIAGAFVMYWMYNYVAGKHPVGADQLDQIRDKITGAGKGLKGRAEEFGHQVTSGHQST